MMLRLTSVLGLIVFILISYGISNNRKKIQWKPVIGGCVLQFFFAVLILKTPVGNFVFGAARDFFNAINKKNQLRLAGCLAEDGNSPTV